MPFRPLLLLRIALIQEGKVDYFSAFALVAVVAVLVLAGIWLWQIGLDLWRSSHQAKRLAGTLLLALAAAYTLTLAGLGYWAAEQLLALF